MKKKDSSREIFEKYYNLNRIVEITLKDDSVIVGILSSFIHGDESVGEPFIIKWHFIDKDEFNKHDPILSMEGYEEAGRIINQDDIKSVKLKI
jgi:hypothetical protein